MTNKNIGKQYGKLKVIKQEGRLYNKLAYICECDCGRIRTTTISKLNSGIVKSCGICNRASRLHVAAKVIIRDCYKDFNGTIDQFIELISKNCYYCNCEPYNSHKYKYKDGEFILKYNGLDRFNNDYGHTIDNVVPCCKKCNISKRDRTKDEFISWAFSVRDNLKNRGLI